MNYLVILKNKVEEFWNEEDGIGTVEMILILVVLIGIVVIFKDNLNDLVESLFRTINSQAKKL